MNVGHGDVRHPSGLRRDIRGGRRQQQVLHRQGGKRIVIGNQKGDSPDVT